MHDDTFQRCISCGRTCAQGYRACPWCGAALPTGQLSASMLGPGAQIDFGWGTAIIDRPLGEGGMGIVYHAWLHS